MKKALKWIGIVVLCLVILASITSFYFVNDFNNRTTQSFEVTPQNISMPVDSASLVEGERLVNIHCTTCHGKDLSGTEIFNDPILGSIPATNLTSGRGGKGVVYDDQDYVRAIRHGVKMDGTAAFVMPAKEFQYMSDKDLGCIIAYLKTIPPVNKEWEGPKLTYIAKSLAGMGVFGDIINAENIDHPSLTKVASPTPGPSAEYGHYLVQISGCKMCHGEQLNGKQPEEPGPPFSPNITPGGNIGNWSQTQFIHTIRTGNTPENRKLQSQYMPWESFKIMNDDELTAIYKFLRSQPKLPTTDL